MSDKRFLAKYDGKKGEWLHDAKFFVIAVVIIFLLLRFVIGISWVDGTSMSPTLEDGSMVVYTRLGNSYETGDIVSIKMPSGKYFIKRIVAVAGDTVDLKDGQLYVNGAPETGDYVYGSTEPEEGFAGYPYTLSEGQVFALGDNREESTDSRSFGPMAVSQIRGKILFAD